MTETATSMIDDYPQPRARCVSHRAGFNAAPTVKITDGDGYQPEKCRVKTTPERERKVL